MHIQNIAWPLFSWKKAKTSTRTVGVTSLVIVVLAGATATSFGKQLTTALSPLSMIFITELMMILFTLMTFGLIPVFSKLFQLKKKDWIPIIGIGTLSSIIAPLLLFSGLYMTEAINAELFARSNALFLFILAIFFLRERIERAQVLAGMIMLLGIGVVILRGGRTIDPHLGDMLILFSACFYSAGAIIFKKYLSHLDHELVLFTRASIALGFFFLVSPFLEHNLMAEVRAFPLVLLPALIGFSFVARFLYLMSFYEAMERLTVRTVSLVMPLMVVVSVIFAHFYLSEIIHWYHVVGGALIVLGMVLLQLSNLHPTEKNLEGEMKMHHKHHV